MADLAKHVIVNHADVGSNPTAPANVLLVQSGKTAACQVANIGSDPIQHSNFPGPCSPMEGRDASNVDQCRFESCQGFQNAGVPTMKEALPSKQMMASLILVTRSNFNAALAQLGRAQSWYL